MCTSIVEIVAAEGMAKREDAWFPLTHAVVAYDHARHALLADVITLDFVDGATKVGWNGENKGAIAGEPFNRALSRIWIGDKPVQTDLKKALLGG